MKLGGRATELTYCTNVHPGTTWPEVRQNLARFVVPVKARVCPDRPFGVGLWLSHLAVAELEAPAQRTELASILRGEGLYVATLNGFPYGSFHGVRVKELVYRPDWLEPDRLAYANRLAVLLAELIPEGGEATVSTVPGAFAPRAPSEAERESIAANLLRHVQFVHNLRERTGRTITLALEPEPACVIETSSDVIQFFRDYVFRGPAFEALGEGAREIVHRHLGVCYDACHLAVQYEEPGQVLEAFDAAGIRVLKAQLSAGLRVDAPDRAALREALQPFADPVYLHQVVERREDGYRRYVDLPDALRAPTEGALEWRIHYHVPIYREALEPFTSTQAHLKALLGALASRSEHPMLEVETYTWDVLPARERLGDVVASMTRELNWVMEQLP